MSDKKIITLTKEECYCGIIELYDLIARKLGYDSDKVGYDCRKIDVTRPIQDQVFAFYRNEQKASDESIGTAWVCYGPKACLLGDDYVAEVSEGFITAGN